MTNATILVVHLEMYR